MSEMKRNQGGNGSKVADMLGWSRGKVSNYRMLLNDICEEAWGEEGMLRPILKLADFNPNSQPGAKVM